MIATIENALSGRRTADVLAAWETFSTEKRRLFLFDLEGIRPVQIGVVAIEDESRDEVTSELRARGVRVGARDPRNEHVWSVDAGRIVVWSTVADGRVLEATRGGSVCVAGREIPSSAVTQVVTYVSDDMTERGVRLELADGGAVVVARDEDMAPLADPGYNVDNLTIDGAWANFLGRAVADALGVPHVEQYS
jgi:hypothetical protein